MKLWISPTFGCAKPWVKIDFKVLKHIYKKSLRLILFSPKLKANLGLILCYI